MEISIRSIVKSIQTIHAAIIAAVIILLAFSIYFNLEVGFGINDKRINNILLIVVLVFSLLCILISIYYPKKQLLKLKKLNELNKIKEYKRIHIIKTAFINGATYFAVTSYLITSKYWFLIVSIILINILGIYIPTKSKIAKETQINYDKL